MSNTVYYFNHGDQVVITFIHEGDLEETVKARTDIYSDEEAAEAIADFLQEEDTTVIKL